MLSKYLTHITMSIDDEENTNKMMAYLGISHPAFELNYSKIGEVPIRKKAQGRANSSALGKCIKGLFSRWQKRWLVIGTHSLWYYNSYEDQPFAIKDNIQVDSSAMMNWTSLSNKGVEVTLYTSRRELTIAVDDLVDGLNTIHYLTQLFKSNEYCKVHQFQALSPKRKENLVEFFSDGEAYFDKIFDLMRLAEREILICGWMISPEMPLKRPFKGKLSEPCETKYNEDEYDEEHREEERKALIDDSRLNRILLSVARRGVNVYILVYKEFSMKMFNDSEHVEKTLTKLHPRIKVMRHPNKMFSLWSHHEKAVIIDRKVVMMGGLDLTWGRWDTCGHPLFEKGDQSTGFYFPGIDYYNPMKKDIVKGRIYQSTLLSNPHVTPRMPWHDIASMLAGPIVKDFVSHFIGYWNHAKDVCDESEALFQQMAVKNKKGEFVDHAQTEEVNEEIADIFAALNIHNFINGKHDFEEPNLNSEVLSAYSGNGYVF